MQKEYKDQQIDKSKNGKSAGFNKYKNNNKDILFFFFFSKLNQIVYQISEKY